MGVSERFYSIRYLIWLPLLGYLTYVMYRLAFFDSISSVANDSVNYLVMARHYSPWVNESEAISQAWPSQDFPPFFPILLALTGAAHSLLYAHILVVLVGFICLYFLHQLSLRYSNDEALAVLVTSLFALSPGYMLGLQGILSEALYLALSLAFLLLYQPEKNGSKSLILALGCLLAAILLTRTIGYALLFALVIQFVIGLVTHKKALWPPILITIISIALYLFVMWAIGPERESHYIAVISNTLPVLYSGEWISPLLGKLQYVFDAWMTFWIIYWTNDISISYLVIVLLLLFSFPVWLLRLWSNKLDAWYVLLYLIILLIWPHPGQMVRLLFPIAPVILIYAFMPAIRCKLYFSNKRACKWGVFTLAGIFLASVLPAHAFMHGRVELAKKEKLVPVYEIFRKPDLLEASRDLYIQNQMIMDYVSVSNNLSNHDQIFYFSPEHLAILGNLRAYKINSPKDYGVYLRKRNASERKVVFLTVLHPRKTRKGVSGFSGSELVEVVSEKKWCSINENTGELVSCFYLLRD